MKVRNFSLWLARDAATVRLQAVHGAAQAPLCAVPTSSSFSRFLANVVELEETLRMLTGMIGTLREQLMAALPDFGSHRGYDGEAIESNSNGRGDTIVHTEKGSVHCLCPHTGTQRDLAFLRTSRKGDRNAL